MTATLCSRSSTPALRAARGEWQRRYLAVVRGQPGGLAVGAQRAVLWLASGPYGLAVRLRNRLFDLGMLRVERAPVPVISVGNLTVGGTGKTPCVEYVARHYRQRSLRVAILSRGYGAAAGPNDEALVLEENLPDVPHFQGADRVVLAGTAVEECESEVLVLDDGFQHRRLARDLDLVLIDAAAPWSLDYLLPRGLRREPMASLRRADAVLLTRCDQADASQRRELTTRIRRYTPAPLFESRHEPVELLNAAGSIVPLATLAAGPVAAFCGLGNPQGFEQTLRGLGANLVDFRTFPDHHAYTRSDIEDLEAWAAKLPANAVVATTQKDLVKVRLTRLAGRPLWCVRVQLAVEQGRADLERLLDKAVEQVGT